ncbi:hypothetical protein HKX48_006517 [Thoreauomyces humboldtii]|nr:hypothetical protein HKX48_006517 [Thoreauomyces humboldtii]
MLLRKLSARLVSFSPRSREFGFLILLYTIGLMTLSWAEGKVHASFPTTTPDHLRSLPGARPVYTFSDLGAHFDHSGSTGRRWTAFCFLLELPVQFAWTVFTSMLVSGLCLPLVYAEDTVHDEGKEVAKKPTLDTARPDAPLPTKPAADLPTLPLPSVPTAEQDVMPDRTWSAVLLNTLPVFVLVVQWLENILLTASISLYDPDLPGWPAESALTPVIAVVPRVGVARRTLTRICTTLTVMTVLVGWIKVLLIRKHLGNPLLGPPRPEMMPPTMPPGARLVPRGLTPASMIGDQTWKPAEKGRGASSKAGNIKKKDKLT